MKKRILITSALPYANGSLHFGHLAGSYLPADIYARFERMKGNEVLFISGSDEYGVAITLSAEMQGRSNKEHVDFYHAEHKSFFEKLHISFDYFGRTSDPLHAPLVQQFFLDLYRNGFVKPFETMQLYSESENRFLADRYVVGICPRCGFESARGDECGKCGASFESSELKSPRSKLTGQPLVLRKTTHYFLLLDQFKEKLARFLQDKKWRSNVLRFALHYLEEIKPRAITRDIRWGVKVPLKEAEEKVFYVWFDAPIGYISITQTWAEKMGSKEAWKPFWLDEKTKYVQFLGKDNIPFHALLFPAMIMGQNEPYKQVDDLVASEFYNLEGRQFSKSEGWTIDLEDVLKRYSVDQLRYFITATMPETSDAEFSWSEFQSRTNSELVGKFGNLIHRVLVFVQNNTDAKLPVACEKEEIDERFIKTIQRLISELEESFSSYHFRKITQLIMELAQEGNVYFDAKAPWRDAKAGKRERMQTTLNLCLELIKKLALYSYPVMPESAEKIWKMIGFEDAIEKVLLSEAVERELSVGKTLIKPEPLFVKMEDEVLKMESEKLKSLHEKTVEKSPQFAPIKAEITYEEFQKLDLRVGLVTAAEKVEKSKKLLKLEVDLGFEKRVIVSGIAEHYSAERVIGKKVIVVCNLKPAKIMGIVSSGMILAGSIDSKLELPALQELDRGALVT